MVARILFTTQDIGIRVFWNLFQHLRKAQYPMESVGFFVTNELGFKKFCQSEPDFKNLVPHVASEWDILKKAVGLHVVDKQYISKAEAIIGDPTFWNAIICDRRFSYNIRAQFQQDYSPRYNHDQLLRALQAALMEIDELFEKVRPEVVIGLNAVTMFDWLIYLKASSSKIPYLQLKLTRIKNYVSLYSNPLGISQHLAELIQHFRLAKSLSGSDLAAMEEARAFLESSAQGDLSYEGAIAKKGQVASRRQNRGLVETVRQVVAVMYDSLAADPHYPSSILVNIQLKLIRPIRRWRVKRWFHRHTQSLNPEKIGDYALYPLNTEPEVALLVYGRTMRNQIESVRNCAAALPVTWKLVVKEHPNAIGYRSIGFYEKLEEIPNVVLASAESNTASLVARAKLVFVVFGTIGFEAIIKKIPVICFSESPYSTFPRSMVRYVRNLGELGFELRDLISNYKWDYHEVLSYVAAHIRGSAKANLFTGLLGKSGRNTLSGTATLDEQYAGLARYTIERIRQEASRYDLK